MMETEPEVGEVSELKERLQDLKNDGSRRINTGDREAGNPFVQTIVNHDIKKLVALGLVRVFL